MPVHVVPKRPVVFLPRWDVRTAMMFNEMNHRVVASPKQEHDVIVFTDGPPISPFLYGEKKVHRDPSDVERDLAENALLRSLDSNKPKIGLGRGAHLLNMFNGGSSWQSVSNHLLGSHQTTNLITGTILYVTSQHWQVMRPSSSADVLLIADVGRTYRDDKQQFSAGPGKKIDIEACYYANTNSLCFQPSPELGHKATRDLLYELAHESLILSRGCEATFAT